MRFPKRIKFRGRPLAVIYKPSANVPVYRLAWNVAGRRHMKRFERYGDAKRHADELVKSLYSGSQVTALTPGQAADALAALQRLDRYYRDTGQRVSLLAGISEYCEAAEKVNGRSLNALIEEHLDTAAVVKRVDLAQAAEEFIEARAAKTMARDGRRPQLSQGYHYNVSMWLREFAATFPGHAVCGLSKELIDTYMGQFGDRAPKTRNERRNVVRMFIKWAVKKDYLPRNHSLLESAGMEREAAEPEEIEFYSTGELQALLNRASRAPKLVKDAKQSQQDYRELVPLIALCALGGVRLAEAARLTWADVWHIEGHVEVTAGKSKTRARRLVPICPALGQWLAPYKSRTGPIWTQCIDAFHVDFNQLLTELKISAKRNGVRHGFVSAHFAAHSNENLTAATAGTSPAMVFKHYRALMTKKQGEAWFAVTSKRPGNVIQFSNAKSS